jgi:hypothetical protein
MFSGKGVKSIAATPDVMYGRVACAECHSVVKQGKKGSNQSVKTNCVACHSKDYAGLVDDWKAQDKKLQDKYAGSLSALEKEIGEIEKQEGRHSVPLRAGFDEIAGDTQFLLKGRVYHNPKYAEAIAAKIEKNTSALQSMIKTKKEGRKLILQK